MNTKEKSALAFQGRSDTVAVAIRMKAARLFAGLSQQELADAVKRQVSNISNIERAKNLPGWSIMLFLHHEHRINVSFIMTGDYAQLPGDVQDGIFEHSREIVAKTDLLDDQDRPPLFQEA